ncbi:hypothetical protein EYB53_000605 [Candidatus Chloroploca sp. M-50]|uniref:Uncharacterized protein n=1 Tax=Candidatus Chloroploca mongolica TaxID=2528176 RepID=A0ABS4D431_9CHLR|nr:hypothetical protein [Candidatus Chloroploca mongolica]MBP1464195.1 hypothetical protein [Candidatus Chloroploca mongolica]
MGSTDSRRMKQASQRNGTLETRGILGNLSHGVATIIAVVITVGTVATVAFSLDRLFASFGV